MLAIVRIALSRPYTFIVAALLILLIGTLAALRMPVDIFPSINIPIIGVAFQYQGLPPDQMAGRIITPFERALTTTVNDIEHFEANSYTTFGIVKIFFHPTVNIATANAQVTAIAQSLLKQMPPGTTPPLIINYSASTVPIIQLALSGKGLTEQNLADLGLELRAPAAGHGAGRGHPLAVRRQDAAGDVRSRHRGARVARPDRARRRQCACRAEPDHPRRHGKDRRLRIHRQPQQRALENLRAWRPADQERRRRDGVHARRRPRAQRQRGTDQYRPRGRQSLGADQRVQERCHLDARHRQRHQEDADESSSPRCPTRSTSSRSAISRYSCAPPSRA